MKINEVLLSKEIIFEYGKKKFPGYGLSLFTQRFYEYIATKLITISDVEAREWLTNWMSDLFLRDNSKFNPKLFLKAVSSGKVFNSQPVFEQRHFFYLAEMVKNIQDQHIQTFARDWLGDVTSQTNPKFQKSVWDKYCAKDKDADSATNEIDEEYLEEGPAYGLRAHGGFGQKFFTRAHYVCIAQKLQDINDKTVRQHIIDWFVKIFKLDNSDFKADVFSEIAMSDRSAFGRITPSVKFEQRHFYFLAHEVSEISDTHERKFVGDWLARKVGAMNDNFQIVRWEKYCNLSAEDEASREVKRNRARANKDIPVNN